MSDFAILDLSAPQRVCFAAGSRTPSGWEVDILHKMAFPRDHGGPNADESFDYIRNYFRKMHSYYMCGSWDAPIIFGVGKCWNRYNWSRALKGVIDDSPIIPEMVPSVFGAVAAVTLKQITDLSPPYRSLIVIDGNATETAFASVENRKVLKHGYAGGGYEHVINDVSLIMGISTEEAQHRIDSCARTEIMAAHLDESEPSVPRIVRMRLDDIAANLLRRLRAEKIDWQAATHVTLTGGLPDMPGAVEIIQAALQKPVSYDQAVILDSKVPVKSRHYMAVGLLELAYLRGELRRSATE